MKVQKPTLIGKGEENQMRLISKRSFVWLAVCLLASVVSVSAQVVNYSLTTVPNLSAATGDAEVLGSTILTVSSISGAPFTVTQTIQYQFPGISCDNNSTSTPGVGGVTVIGTGAFAGTVTFSPVPGDVANYSTPNPNVCIVDINVATTTTPAIGDAIKLDGVRARMEFWSGGITTPVVVSVVITSSNAGLSVAPSTGTVTTAYPVLETSVTLGTYLTCGTIWEVINEGGPLDNPATIEARAHIHIQEPAAPAYPDFSADFVDYTIPDPDKGGPTNARPHYGETNGTKISIWVYNVPTGVTLTFPSHVHGNMPASPGYWDHLVIDPSSSVTVTGSATPNSTLVEYDYTCGDQSMCDTTLESFDVVPGVSMSSLSVTGTITVQVQMEPRSTPVPGGVASFTTAPGTNGTMPRWSDPLQPSPAANFVFISPCSTTLLFPWTANISGWDTGLVIDNTTQDYTNAAGLTGGLLIAPTGTPAYPSITPTPAEYGTCTLYFFPQNEATVITYTTASISSGGSWSGMMSGTPFAGNEGYIIARCNFQYAHGFATIGQPSVALNFAQTYIALVIPDPLVMSLTIPTFGLGSRLDSNVSVVPNTGEALNQ